MSLLNQISSVEKVTGVTELLSSLSEREQIANQNLIFPDTKKKDLHYKTEALRKNKTATMNNTNDPMLLIENQVVMAKWHTEINFYSRIIHQGISAVDTVIKGQ